MSGINRRLSMSWRQGYRADPPLAGRETLDQTFMRIAHVTATFPPYLGGTGRVCYQNAIGLAGLGNQVEVFTADHPPGDHAYPSELVVHRLPVAFRVGNAPFMPELFRRLRGFDLVHLHYPFIFGQEMLYLQSWRRGVRYVITYHQDVILDGVMGVGIRVHHAVLGQAILRRACRLMVTSLDYARSARIAPLVRAMGERVVEMPNGVDPDRFRPDLDSRDLRAAYGLAPEDRVVLFVGGLDTPHYFKGVDVLIRCMRLIDEADVKLLVVGDGDLRPRYAALAQELGLGGRVIFCGRVSDEQLPAHYALCDLGVLPSTTMGEAFGLVLLEAMACGRPVIASNLPGVRSVVSDGENGLLSTPGDGDELAAKIRLLLGDPARRQAMGRRGRAKVEVKYAWPRINARLEQVYREVLTSSTP